MTEPDDFSSVRRIGRKDRKRRITTASGSLFPPEAETSSPEITPEPEVTAGVYTPPEERFPPVAPEIPKNIRPRTARQMARKRRVARQDVIALFFFIGTLLVIGYVIYIWQNPYSELNILQPVRPVIYVTATPGAEPASNLPLHLVNGVTYSANPSACDAMTIAGVVTDTTVYAVRVSSATLDEGVLTGTIPDLGANSFRFILPRETDEYTVELFDTAGNSVLEPVLVEVREGCEFNQALLTFSH